MDIAWQEAQNKMEGAAKRNYPNGVNADLNATIRIVHGADLIAENQKSDEAMCEQFERWIEARYPVTVQ